MMRGRPKLPPEQRKIARTVRLTEAEDRAHKEAARRAGMRVTEWRRKVLADAVKENR